MSHQAFASLPLTLPGHNRLSYAIAVAIAHGVRSSCVTTACHSSQTAGVSPGNQSTLTGHVAAMYAASFPTFYLVRTHLDRKLIEVGAR